MITVVLNSAAGTAGQATLATEIAALFLAAGLDATIQLVGKAQDPGAMARAALATSSIVVAGGGDGTVSSVAAALAGSAAVLGVLPLGTLNHFAKDLHIPLHLDEAVATIAAGHVRRIDVGQVNDRLFINNSSIGIYPSIVEAREELRRQGQRKWPAFVIATVRVLRRYRGVFVRLDVDGIEVVRRTPMVFVGNNAYRVEGIHMGGRTRLDEGRLYAYLAPRMRTRQLPKLLVKALFGRAVRAGDFEILPAHELWVATPRRRVIQVSFDGEVRAMTQPLHYRARPGALNVLVPAE